MSEFRGSFDFVYNDNELNNFEFGGTEMRIVLEEKFIDEKNKMFQKVSKDLMINKKGHVVIFDKKGKVYKPISNFIAYPVSSIKYVGDSIISQEIELEGVLDGKYRLPKIRVTLDELKKPDWIERYWGVQCIVFPELKAYEYIRIAIKMMASKVPDKYVIAEIGWQKINSNWMYVHGDGKIGKLKKLDFEVTSEMKGFEMYYDKDLDEVECFNKVLKMLDVASHEITYTLLSYSLLSLMNTPLKTVNLEPNFLVWLHGETGSRKTTLATLFGNIFNRNVKRVSASFKDTKANLEYKAYEYKDSTLIIDDYHPSANRLEKSEMESKANYIIRLYGDRIGKGRMSRNLTKLEEHLPRGLALITGEDIIDGHSAISRCISVPIGKSNVNLKKLSKSQQNTEKISTGYYYYIKWLSKSMDDQLDRFYKDFTMLRESNEIQYSHGRMVESLIWLQLGFKVFLDYGVSLEAITVEEQNAYLGVHEKLVSKLLKNQERNLRKDRPVHMYLSSLNQLIDSKCLSIIPIGDAKKGRKNHIGWEDSEYYYLIPGIAYNEVVNYWRRQNKEFPLGMNKLHQALGSEEVIKEFESSEESRIYRTKKKKVTDKDRTRVLYVNKNKMQEYLDHYSE